MWNEISKLKDFVDDQPKFFNISKLAQLVISLPHSNAEAERIFSMMNDIKTKKRNKIGDDALNAVTVVRSSLQDKNINCVNFKVTSKHLELHNSKSLY